MVVGIALVDKPQGPTSHRIVGMARKALGLKKVGHAGTLDPMATGLLVLGVGPGTKLLTYLVGLDKTYRATIRLGQATDTDDAEGEPIGQVAPAAVMDELSPDTIAAALEEFVGPISQSPSAVSAIKVDGQRAYDRVRAGETVELAARPVTIHSITVHSTQREGEFWDVDCTIECSSGTYIRAIARDLGQRLGVGGHLTALRRTAVGPFEVADATTPEDLTEDRLLPLATVASRVLPVVNLTHAQSVELGHGKQVFLDRPEGAGPDTALACVSPDGHLVAICRVPEATARILVGFSQGG